MRGPFLAVCEGSNAHLIFVRGGRHHQKGERALFTQPLVCMRELFCLSNLAPPSKEEGAGGDEPKLGLVDPFGARILEQEP